jgi:hypothetical protein
MVDWGRRTVEMEPARYVVEAYRGQWVVVVDGQRVLACEHKSMADAMAEEAAELLAGGRGVPVPDRFRRD